MLIQQKFLITSSKKFNSKIVFLHLRKILNRDIKVVTFFVFTKKTTQ